MTKCTERIESADSRGDTKTIYAEVKRLSGTGSRGDNTRPTAEYREPEAADEKKDEHIEGLASKIGTDTRSKRQQEELASKKVSETDNLTRNAKSEESKSVSAKNNRNGKPLELASSGETDVTVDEAVNRTPPRGILGSGHSKETRKTTTRTRARLASPADLANN